MFKKSYGNVEKNLRNCVIFADAWIKADIDRYLCRLFAPALLLCFGEIILRFSSSFPASFRLSKSDSPSGLEVDEFYARESPLLRAVSSLLCTLLISASRGLVGLGCVKKLSGVFNTPHTHTTHANVGLSKRHPLDGRMQYGFEEFRDLVPFVLCCRSARLVDKSVRSILGTCS